jgi:hypothetical protein
MKKIIYIGMITLIIALSGFEDFKISTLKLPSDEMSGDKVCKMFLTINF